MVVDLIASRALIKEIKDSKYHLKKFNSFAMPCVTENIKFTTTKILEQS